MIHVGIYTIWQDFQLVFMILYVYSATEKCVDIMEEYHAHVLVLEMMESLRLNSDNQLVWRPHLQLTIIIIKQIYVTVFHSNIYDFNY